MIFSQVFRIRYEKNVISLVLLLNTKNGYND